RQSLGSLILASICREGEPSLFALSEPLFVFFMDSLSLSIRPQYYRSLSGWNSSTGLPEGSSRMICEPPGPLATPLAELESRITEAIDFSGQVFYLVCIASGFLDQTSG